MSSEKESFTSKSSHGPKFRSSQRMSKSAKIESNSLKSIYEEDDNVFAKANASTICSKMRCFKSNTARDELVLIFFSSMLEYITEKWYIIPENFSFSLYPKSSTSDIIIKDYKTLSNKDLRGSVVLGVNGSEVQLDPSERKAEHWNNSAYSKRLSINDNIGYGVTGTRQKTFEISKSKDAKLKDRSKISKKSFQLPPLSGEVKSLSLNSEPKLLEPISSDDLKESEQLDMEVVVSFNPQTSFSEFEQSLRIKFINGNIYEGKTVNKLMDGKGVFYWTDGTVYQGNFKKGNITGKGKMVFSDLSWYEGEFCNGYREGEGVMNVLRTPLIYSGSWKAGKFHGKGWLLYDVNNWYDGEWQNGGKHGHGLRQYGTGGRYKGEWENDMRNGLGSMLWHNNDFYRGHWLNNLMHGYGEYTWNSFYNTTLTFPLENSYEGWWKTGLRHGAGKIDFGVEGGVILEGHWEENRKHGAGKIVCGNGRIINLNPLFLNDKPIHLQSMCSLKNRTYFDVSSDVTTKEKNCTEASIADVSAKSATRIHYVKQADSNADVVKKRSSRLTKDSVRVPRLNPVEIPLQIMSDGVDVSYFIDRIPSKAYCSQESELTFFINQSKRVLEDGFGSMSEEIKCSNNAEMYDASSTVTSLDDEANQFFLAQFEEKEIRQVLIRLMPQLQSIYNIYASITAPKNIEFKAILIRLYLWQLYVDIGIYDKKISLIDTDLLLSKIPYSGVEDDHDPFEKIYFWQFLLSLLAVAFEVYEQDYEKHPQTTRGIVAYTFTKFLEDDVLPNVGKNIGWALYDFRDLLPIRNMYSLYKKLGYPPTARTFLRNCCVRKNHCPPEYLKAKDTDVFPEIERDKKNIVLDCGRIIYCNTDLKEVVPQPKEQEIEIPELSFFSDPFRTQLFVLRSLGTAKVVDCIREVCPLIMDDGIIVNMEYPLTFLEFYNVLLLCVFTLIDRELKKFERAHKKEQTEQEKIELEEEEVIATTELPPIHLPKIKGTKSKKGSKRDVTTA